MTRPFLLLLFFLCSCTFSPFSAPKKSKQDLVAEIRQKASQKIQHETGLILLGYGSQMMEQIEMLSLTFQCERPLTLEDGRALLLSSVQTYLDTLNSSPSIQQYLAAHPFDSKHIEIRIFIQDSDPDHLQYISFMGGVLEFYHKAPNGSGFQKIHQESL